jgi:hypothetical protein
MSAVICLAIVVPMVFGSDERSEPRRAIEQLVQSASVSNDPVVIEQLLSESQIRAIGPWLEQNGEAIIGKRGGPFAPGLDANGAEYATTYDGNRIYVHVLNWNQRNNVTLPPIINHTIARAWILGDRQNTEYPWGIVRQHPWGTLLVYPDAAQETIRVFVIELEGGDASELVAPIVIRANPNAVVRLRGDTARLNGALQYDMGPDWITNWRTSADEAEWRVDLDTPTSFKIALTYACPDGSSGAALELIAGDTRLEPVLRKTRGWAGESLAFERRVLEGQVSLDAGPNTIALRVGSKPNVYDGFKLYSIELISSIAEKEQLAAAKRAAERRADTEWLARARYGLMVHWMPGTQPRRGAQKPFPDAVKTFDVAAFADMVEESGADYLVFTAVHGIQWFPGPNDAIARILPGRTCDRDLIRDLADACKRRDIKLILYYHHGVGDYEWAKASGFLRKDKSGFFQNEYDILAEIGTRYGKKVAGFWFDDRYPDQPFEHLFEATKTGNADRIVAWNSWILPKSTEFQEYYAGEAGNVLKLPDASYFQKGGPAEGLQPQFLIFLDDAWHHGQPNTDIVSPLYTDEQVIRYVRECNSLGGPATLNVSVYQDGTASPETLKQLDALKNVLEQQ